MNADGYDEPLDRAAAIAKEWLHSLGSRRVAPEQSAAEVRTAFPDRLPDEGSSADAVVAELAAAAEPGLMAIGSGRFFGWVMGGVLPAALAADWLVSAWDQNTGLRFATPATAALEECAATWLLDLLGLPASCEVGFVTGATMANFTCLAAARQAQLAAAGWDVGTDGLSGAPRLRVIVGCERHDSVDVALRYLGLGAPIVVAADDQGRVRTDALADALADCGGPAIVCLQAGNLHSGAFDPFADAVDVAHRHGAWVHVDGAFGLWAAAAPELAPLVTGMAGADSWATDAHKTLNTPYDCGLAIVRDAAAMRSAMGMRASYLITDGSGDPLDRVPEMSRRARGVPVWAALRSLGRAGVANLVGGLVHNAQALAAGVDDIAGAEVLNDVVYTQLSLAFGSDERTEAVTKALLADGTTWMSGSRWRDRAVMRVSVSNWSTDDNDIALSLDAIRRAVSSAGRVRALRRIHPMP
ncbi:MAG: aspartate aminotransferase family protein [Frankiales bacterium]|nr:aspartate aminotransferase family protein [Frankiales bacterium]